MPRASRPASPRLAPPLRMSYALSLAEPESHLFGVEVDVRGALPRPLHVAMPAWAPGSYLIRDFARHVQDFEALDGRGRALPWARVDKQTWQIEPPERASRVVVR